MSREGLEEVLNYITNQSQINALQQASDFTDFPQITRTVTLSCETLEKDIKTIHK